MKNDILNNNDAFIFDYDGTLMQFGTCIQSVFDLIEKINSLNKSYIILTNDAMNCSKSKSKIITKKYFNISEENIITCADLTVKYLIDNEKLFSNLFILGSLGGIDKLEKYFNIFYDNGNENYDNIKDPILVLGSNCNISDKLLFQLCLNIPIKVYIPNGDLIWMPKFNEIQFCPGAISHKLEKVFSIYKPNIKFITCGKPSVYSFIKAEERINYLSRKIVKRNMTLVIGDSLYSDISPAKKFGFNYFQVNTGLSGVIKE